MELDNIYTNMNYDHLKQDRKQQNLKSDRGGVQSTESVRGKWSSLVIYILLGVSILLSVVMLITAVILFTQLFTIMKMLETDFKMGLAQLQHNVTVLSSDMKTLETDFKMDLAQVQNNVTQLFTIMKMLETDFKMGLAQLQHNVTVLSSDMKTLETDFKMDLAQVQNNVTQLFTIMKMLETDFKMGLAQLQHNESKTWKEAQRACRSLDANLVVINKPEEQAFIKTWFQRKNRWIGLTDSISEDFGQQVNQIISLMKTVQKYTEMENGMIYHVIPLNLGSVKSQHSLIVLNVPPVHREGSKSLLKCSVCTLNKQF
ncbi:C-type lectin domain family 10 member A-like isoform X3 [Hemiscyllium ocellatum]|uniref:C-type lectin domain family 10 member A-like isoform X3 n=1 Tax=Hemiscyllium ocellatum TaxID=170820 RepID=UPI002966E12A|nr:C-type lectin domain family 10 member A-like isoform X3 [Hemiscyllium ocellatum]